MLKVCLALFATVLAAYPAHSQSPIDENVIAIVVGDGQFAAKATIDGATVRRAIIYGRANDIAKALGKK